MTDATILDDLITSTAGGANGVRTTTRCHEPRWPPTGASGRRVGPRRHGDFADAALRPARTAARRPALQPATVDHRHRHRPRRRCPGVLFRKIRLLRRHDHHGHPVRHAMGRPVTHLPPAARCGTATAPPNTPRTSRPATASSTGATAWCCVPCSSICPRRPGQTPLGKDVIQRTLANAARTGANPASVMQSENDNVPTLRRP